jgi:stringent starvation protein B
MPTTKPYLMRAIFEWAEDNGYTPQVLVNAEASDVEVPLAHVVDGQIVLNISSSAVQLHVMDNECLSFSARFSGIEQDIFLPMDSILAIFARENSQGIFFEEMGVDDSDPEPTSPTPVPTPPGPPTKLQTKTKPKRDASHLKIIK